MKSSSDLSIIDKIDSLQNRIDEKELDEVLIPALLKHYDSKIRKLAFVAYDGESEVGYKSFREHSKSKLKVGVMTFSVKYEHWKDNRSVGPYLVSCLNAMSIILKSKSKSKTKCICPVCNLFCSNIAKNLHCDNCSKEVNRISSEKNPSCIDLSMIEMHKVFENHSQKGYSCTDCKRFIPDSFVKGKAKIFCPYNDCSWFGILYGLEKKIHPRRLGNSPEIILSDNNFSEGQLPKNTSLLMMRQFPDKSPLVDTKIEIAQQFGNDYKMLEDIITLQKSRISKTPSNRAIKKELMYDAYMRMLEKHPSDMVGYLARLKSKPGEPLQAKIFQEYLRILENNLPIKMRRYGKDIEIYSLLDKYLEIFLGISEFEAEVTEKGIVHNETKEEYIASTQNNMGPCFIGLIEDIIDKETGLSIKDKISSYSFSSITMKDVDPGTVVKVIHLRIAPHYETGGMTQLQTVRKKIVDSVKRIKGNDEAN